MWLKFYKEDGTLDTVIDSNKISCMYSRKNSRTSVRTTDIYLNNENYYTTVNKPIEEIMKMIEEGEGTNDIR